MSKIIYLSQHTNPAVTYCNHKQTGIISYLLALKYFVHINGGISSVY